MSKNRAKIDADASCESQNPQISAYYFHGAMHHCPLLEGKFAKTWIQ
jgi:hypothetical protein